MKLFKKIGFTFILAAAIVSATALSAFAGTYTVKKGDTLLKISSAYYGTEDAWQKIYDSNRASISDPDMIYVGMELVIPDVMTKEQFFAMDGQAAYDYVGSSADSWVVSSYDLITPENILETVVVTDRGDGTLSFNLAWPSYGGYEVSTIQSIGDLSGTTEISRIGGDGGYSICFGKNPDGSEFTASQRAIPSSSITYRKGIMNIDLYRSAIDAIASAGSDAEAVSKLSALGFAEDIASKMVSDYAAFFKRPEMADSGNILEGCKLAGREVTSKYGFYGLTAPWKTANLDLVGGSNQMTIAFSFGTMINSGIVTSVEDVK